MVGEIKRVLVKHPKDAYQDQFKIDGESKKLNYLGKPDSVSYTHLTLPTKA